MTGITFTGKTTTNHLEIPIPDELKNIALRIIVLPADSKDESIEFFTTEELAKLTTTHRPNMLNDEQEDYGKW